MSSYEIFVIAVWFLVLTLVVSWASALALCVARAAYVPSAYVVLRTLDPGNERNEWNSPKTSAEGATL